MGYERKVFGDGYCIIWAFYSSLYVFEKVEHYFFNFDNIIFATGGNLGLFLGWSLKSVFIDFIEFLYKNLKKKTQRDNNDNVVREFIRKPEADPTNDSQGFRKIYKW